MNILHGLTGSVAVTVAEKFGTSYKDKGYQSKVIRTSSAERFEGVGIRTFDKRYEDEDEWYEYSHNGDVLHIDLIKWADVFVIAPCSANTLAKIANGLCDNLLTCCARAWDFKKKFIIAPACNTLMYSHPITQEHLDKIKSWGIIVVPPVEKKLFCGDIGIGAMENVEEILKHI